MKKEKRYNISSEDTKLKQDLVSLFIKVVILVAMVVVFLTFFFGVTRYNEGMMYPSIKDGDLVMYYRMDKSYKPNDTVVLNYDGNLSVRRVIGTGGDVIDITEDGLSINGAPQQELGIYEPTERYQNEIDFPIVVPEDSIFVLADSRQNAVDSRVYGTVKIEDTRGKTIMILRRRNI